MLQVIASVVKGEIEGDLEKLRQEVEALRAEIAAGRDGAILSPQPLRLVTNQPPPPQ